MRKTKINFIQGVRIGYHVFNKFNIVLIFNSRTLENNILHTYMYNSGLPQCEHSKPEEP